MENSNQRKSEGGETFYVRLNEGSQTDKIIFKQDKRDMIELYNFLYYNKLNMSSFFKLILKAIKEDNVYFLKFIQSYLRKEAPNLQRLFEVQHIEKEQKRREVLVSNFNIDFEYELLQEDKDRIYDILEENLEDF